MELMERLQTAVANAKAAIAAGDLAALKSANAEAEGIRDMIAEAKKTEELSKSYAPVRPTLPNTSNDTLPQVAGSESNTKSDKPLVAGLDASTRQAAYVARFGDTPSMVKQILTELHGNDHESAYWAQKAAFRRYIRGGIEALNSEHRARLSELVFTPAAVKMALNQGVEDIATFRTTMVEAADTLGGFMVPVDFQMRLLERMAGLTVIRSRASVMSTSRDRVELPEATGANGKYTSPVRVTWVDETPTVGSIAENYVTFGLRGISVHTAMAETPLSRNLIEDSAFDIEGYLAKKLAEAAAIDEDRQFILGNGVGKPLGLLPVAANSQGYTEVNSGSGSALTWDGLIKVPFSVPAQYRQQNSTWLMNKNTLQAIALMKDANNNYLLTPYAQVGGDLSSQNPIGHQLLGYPVLEDEDMPDIAANSYPILFGDLSAYTIVDRLGMTVERYLDSQTARQNLIYYVMRRRLGGQPLEQWRLSAQKVST